MLRWLTAGESHGPALVAILEGLPADVAVTTADVDRDLARRRLGVGPWRADEVRAGRGTHPRRRPARAHAWAARSPSRSATASGRSGRRSCRADPVDADVLDGAGAQRAADPSAPRSRRPRRACRSTASTTPARCSSAPAPARPRPAWPSAPWPRRSCSRPWARPCSRHVVELGTVVAPGRAACPAHDDLDGHRRRSRALPRPRPARAMAGRGRGGAQATATPSAASSRWSSTACRRASGSHVHWDRRLDARLAGALMGIQAIKGVEVGDGFELARTRGSMAHDEILPGAGRRACAPPAAAAAPRAA